MSNRRDTNSIYIMLANKQENNSENSPMHEICLTITHKVGVAHMMFDYTPPSTCTILHIIIKKIVLFPACNCHSKSKRKETTTPVFGARSAILFILAISECQKRDHDIALKHRSVAYSIQIDTVH